MEDKTLIDLGWLAGILDGEGTVTLNRGRRTRFYTGWVCIANRRQEVLERCRRIASTRKLSIPQYNKSNGTLVWSGWRGTKLLELLWPYITSIKLLTRGLVYRKFYSPESINKHQPIFKAQLWEVWKDLIRKEYEDKQSRGPKPWWLVDE